MPRSPRLQLKDEGPPANLLVVEGADDFHVFLSLLDASELRGQCRVEEGGGYDRMRDSIDTRIDESGLERLGLVVDADENIGERWDSLRDVLITRCGYRTVPAAPQAAGTIISEDDKVTVGLWLMPNNIVSGALEEFIRLLIPENDILWNYAQASVENLPLRLNPLTENWESKAELHTWLAWQKEPGKPIGQAITKRYLNPQTQEAQTLFAWLRKLFSP